MSTTEFDTTELLPFFEIQKINLKLQDFSGKGITSCKTKHHCFDVDNDVDRFMCKNYEMTHNAVQIEVSKTEQNCAELMCTFIELSLFLT